MVPSKVEVHIVKQNVNKTPTVSDENRTEEFEKIDPTPVVEI